MARINGISHLPSEIQKQMNKFDLSKVHITTMDYMQFRPIYSRELVPHEVVKMDTRLFTRLTPLVKPAFAHATIETRGFFVPYRTICSWFNDFISQSKSKDDVLHTTVSKLKYIDILNAITNWNTTGGTYFSSSSIFGHYLTQTEYNDGETPDIIVPDTNAYVAGTGLLYCGLFKLNSVGKNAVAQLMTLGYNIPLFPFEPTTSRPFNFIGSSTTTASGPEDWLIDLSVDSDDVDNWYYNLTNVSYSALPLFSLLKVYADWFENPQEEFVTSLGTAKKLVTICESGGTLSAEQILNIMLCMSYVAYDDDYFTTISTKYLDQRGVEQSVFIKDSSLPSVATTGKSLVSSTNLLSHDYTPLISRGDSGSVSVVGLSQFILDSLSALTKVMRRFNIVGNKTIDRYLARFGVKLEAEKLNRSVYLGNMQTDIDVMDVMSLADTDNAILGDYAGKGIGASNGNFNYKCQEEFGQMIIVSIIKPYVSYFQGTPRELSHIGMNDFFSGAYDNLGYQAVGAGELVTSETPYTEFHDTFYGDYSVDVTTQGFWYADDVLGFQPRYAEYKCNQQDLLTGDMRYYSTGRNSYNYFHQFRGFRVFQLTADVQNSFIKNAYDSAQYDRIFATTSNDYDHFIIDIFFKVTSIKPMLPLFDSVEFDDDDKQDHRVVNVPVAGTKF